MNTKTPTVSTKDFGPKFNQNLMLKPYKNFLDINIPEFSWSQIRTAYNTHADEVYGNPTDLTSTIFAEDADAFFEWCDTNGDGEVSLWESASCGAKAGFWQPEGISYNL